MMTTRTRSKKPIRIGTDGTGIIPRPIGADVSHYLPIPDGEGHILQRVHQRIVFPEQGPHRFAEPGVTLSYPKGFADVVHFDHVHPSDPDTWIFSRAKKDAISPSPQGKRRLPGKTGPLSGFPSLLRFYKITRFRQFVKGRQ